MTRSKTATALGSQRQRSRFSLASGSASAEGSEGSFSNHRPALRALLYSSVLTGGLLLVNGAGVVPAYAAPCTGAANGANLTACGAGSSPAGLNYVADNPLYVTGDFELLLSDHDVTEGAQPGINFLGVTAGNGVINLQGDSDIVGGNFGINSALTNGANNTINVNGTSSVSGNFGISATTAGAGGGNVTVRTQASTSVIGNTSTAISAVATTTGNVEVDAQGLVTGQTGGINAASAAGNVKVTTGGTVTGTTDIGIRTLVTGVGNIDVNAQGSVTGGTIGIFADATSGTVKVVTGTNTVTGQAGAGIDATASGEVTVDPDGNVSGSTLGINAVSDVNGNVNVTTFAGATVSGAAGDGINAETTTAGNLGNVVVNAQSAVTGAGAGSSGIDANAINGTVQVTTGAGNVSGVIAGIDATATGAVTVDAGGNVAGTGGIGINAVAQNGLVDVDTASLTTVDGNGGAGIFANANVTGNVDVDALGIVTGSTIGIDASATAGSVNVDTGTRAITGEAGHGINARAALAATVVTNGNVSGIGGSGINASSSGGNVGVTTSGGNVSGLGAGNDGITAVTTLAAGTITISNGSITSGTHAGIDATSAGGAIGITNVAFVQNATGLDSDLAIITAGGATAITNNAFVTGRVLTGAGAFADTLTNNAFWFTEGTSDFGGGNDTVNNNAFLRGADEAGVAETTRLLNLETLSNNGFLDLHDQSAGDGSNISDTLSTSGNYAGGGFFDVDAFLGGPGSNADQLIVGGNVSGVTTILVTDTNAGPGAFNPTGIVVVDVAAGGTTAAGDFVLADGPIDKGLFFYDLLFDAANNNHVLVGLPDQEVFETLAVVASNQEIWRETANAWSTRQENLRDVLATSYGVTAVADPPIEASTAPMASLWVSALGSWSERDDDASFSLLNANLEFDLSYNQDIYGVVGGADFATDVGTDSRMLFGVMAGYVDSNLDFDDSNTSIDTDGATVGVYAALLSNGFFATVLVKADLLNMDFSTDNVDGEDSADVTSWGARGDFGYRFGDTFFVEPMISVDGISTDIDEFTIAGADIDAGTNESFRAGAGLRAGYGDEQVRASATARVWDVFSTDNEVDILAGVPLGISDDDLEGVYGDVSAQVDFSLSTNATIYLKGGVLFSDDVTKPNASGGFALYW